MPSDLPQTNKPAASISFEHVAESMSQLMVSLLERRYLSDFKPAYWEIEPDTHANAQVFLREVQEIGRDPIPEEMFRAVPYILASCHDPAHAFIATFWGSGTRQHIYLGGRRMVRAVTQQDHHGLSQWGVTVPSNPLTVAFC